MSKTILAVLSGLFIIGGSLYLTAPQEDSETMREEELAVERSEKEEKGEILGEEKEEAEEVSDYEKEDLIGCLAERGVVIYGSKTCPACAHLAESFGGYEAVEKIYVECTQERERCNKEKVTGFVPEIQIKEKLYEGQRDPASLARETGCEF